MGGKSEANTTSLFNNVALLLNYKEALSQLHREIIRSNARGYRITDLPHSGTRSAALRSYIREPNPSLIENSQVDSSHIQISGQRHIRHP